LSAGHASAFDWDVATPSWISSFVPNLEAELGLALMFGSMIRFIGGQDGSVNGGAMTSSRFDLGERRPPPEHPA
jgi:hypothetical protein